MNHKKKTIALIIMDGYGISSKKEGNAIYKSKKPNLDYLFSTNPYTLLSASGKDVGLLDGQMGNSEVGHLNIGAGRIVYQNSLRISDAIKKKEFDENKELVKLLNYCSTKSKSLHLIGLLSNGGVHSLNSHLYALLKLAKKKKVKNIYIHCILDGRDTLPQSALKYLKELEAQIKTIGVGEIVSVMGRYYAMDRDTNWDRTRKAYKAMFGEAKNNYKKASLGIKNSYQAGLDDEFVEPFTLSDNKIGQKDALIFFNFRGDRMRQIVKLFLKNDLKLLSLTQYDKRFEAVKVAFPPVYMKNTFGEYISSKNKKQLRIAETTKYAHVTFFFNGGVEKANKAEDRILIASPRVKTFDLKPEMSANKIRVRLLKEIKANKYDFIILNFANCDMVGHSAKMKETVQAVEVVDYNVGLIVNELLKQNGIALITADHGNAEQLIDYKTKKAMTAHTTNPVPLTIVGLDKKVKLKKGILADIVPTILDIANIKKPKEMTGESLIIKK